MFFEGQGLPAAVVISQEFVAAGQAQAAALGLAGFELVPVPHPLQPLTQTEVRALADRAFGQIVARLTKP